MSNFDIHADDYGLTMNVSKDILYGINHNMLNSMSIMPNMKCFEEAKEYYVQNLKEGISPKLSVHLNIMEGYSCSNKEEVGDLVDEKGLFKVSWFDLVKSNYNPLKRNTIKKQLKIEIKNQIKKVDNAYRLLEKGKLRIDSHQHTHMIPIVMESLIEVIEEEKYSVEYIRLSEEPWWIYLYNIKFLFTYSPINILKVTILNFFAITDKKKLKNIGLEPMILAGVFLSGRMDYMRLQKLIPTLVKYSIKKCVLLEVLIHPGSAAEEEMCEEFNNKGANGFYLSYNRKIEYETMLKIKEWR